MLLDVHSGVGGRANPRRVWVIGDVPAVVFDVLDQALAIDD